MKKKLAILFGLLPILPTLGLGMSGLVHAESDIPKEGNLTEITKQAYIYVLPLDIMYRTRWQAIFNSENPYHGNLNEFRHGRRLADPSSRAVTAPNNDTLYSSAWLDLAPEPVVLHVPDTAGRYYHVQFMDFYTNNFADVGRRATGTREGDYLVTGPGYAGETPAGLPVIKSPTNAVWLICRILIDGPEELSKVHALQDQLRLTPLSTWKGRAPGSAPAKPPRTWIRPDPEDPQNFLAVANLAMTENPPPKSEEPLMQEFKRIGVGPGQTFDLKRFSEAERGEILLGIEQAKQELRGGAGQRPRGGSPWNVPGPDLGRYGTNYLLRAMVAVAGLGALTREEAMYIGTTIDADGNRLDGRYHYVLRFPKGGLPPVDAFWSLTMYKTEPDLRSFLVENSIGRYSVGDRTRGLKYGEDGSLSIYIQHDSPGPDKESNWLPAPSTVFRLSLRAYQPRQELLEGRYVVPPVRRVD